MCGRFSLSKPGARLAQLLGVPAFDPGPPRFNIAPTQPVLAVRVGASGREVAWLRWGLVPPGADPKVGARMINARGESVFDKGAFKRAVRERRCLIPTDGFYEWKALGPKTKQPYHLEIGDRELYCMGGIWERWSRGAEVIETCSILTTPASPLVAELHDRMPLILPPEAHAAWLDPTLSDRGRLEAMIVPFPADRMRAVPVSSWVNDAKHEDERCLQAADPIPPEPPPPPRGKKKQLGFDF